VVRLWKKPSDSFLVVAHIYLLFKRKVFVLISLITNLTIVCPTDCNNL